MTPEEARMVNNLSPGNQLVQLGTKLRQAVNYPIPAGAVYYVSRNILSSGDGLSWDTAFKTIGEAIAKVNADYTAALQPTKGRNGTIYVAEGWYSEVPLTLSANDVHIIGVASGSHDAIVLYGSATNGGWDITSGGPALTISGSNNTIANMGFFTHDVLHPAVKDGGHSGDVSGYLSTYNNRFINCNFVRDVNNGSLGGIDCVSNEGPYIEGCRFSTSQKDWGVRVRTNGVTNPVGVRISNCNFVGIPIALLNGPTGIDTLMEDCLVIDDTTDRPGAVTVPISNTGGLNLIAINNFWEFSEANAITGAGDHLMVNNFQLAAT